MRDDQSNFLIKRKNIMGTFDDLAFMDATAQAELVRKKEVQPIELVEAAIERIEKLNDKMSETKP